MKKTLQFAAMFLAFCVASGARAQTATVNCAPISSTFQVGSADLAIPCTVVVAPAPAPPPPPTQVGGTIADIQAMPGWAIVTGSSIGPVAPSAFTFTQPAAGDTKSLVISVTGVKGKYADGMLKFSQPLPANTGNVTMSTTFALNADSLVNAQALELGTKITDAAGITYNGQIQFDYSTSATDMVLDVVNAKGGWTSTGVSIPKFTASTSHTVEIAYTFDTAAKTSSVDSVTVDGTIYPTPPDLQNLPGEALGWAKSELVAGFQPDVNTKGGSFEWTNTSTSWVVF